MTDTPTTDPLAPVQAELSAAMVPWPDDYIDDLTPPAALLLLRQMAMAVSKVVTGGIIALDDDLEADAGTSGEVLNGVTQAVVGSTYALVKLGLLPEEALGVGA